MEMAAAHAPSLATMSADSQMMGRGDLNGLIDNDLWRLQADLFARCGFDVLGPSIVNSMTRLGNKLLLTASGTGWPVRGARRR